ncbi:hypothetical protein F5Y16DRAFT_388772 [Xylariaceae sp. FL0255]|nr:hypothetical protein F5Y16DRAFT_388772 [Xylariaceae sp. FL0255]
MVDLQTVRSGNADLVQAYPLVAVFVGGTSGIGHYTLRELVKTRAASNGSKQQLRIYLVGRNSETAKQIIAECQAISKGGNISFIFVKATNLSLITDVDRVSEEIVRSEREAYVEPRIDLLIMSQGGLYLNGRDETAEGIDLSMAMHYYSRARFTIQLLPLLLKSTLPTGARVISVFAAGMETKFNSSDVSLRKPGSFTFDNARSHATFLTTGFFEKLAADHAGKIALVNMFPGLIITPGFGNPDYPLWFRILWTIFAPLAKFVATSPEEVGQRVLFNATRRYPARRNADRSETSVVRNLAKGTDGQSASGSYGVQNNNEITSQTKRDKVFDAIKDIKRDAFPQFAWAHTLQVFDDIARTGKCSR